MVELVSLDRFLELRESLNIVDVRSPVEYDHAHIPESFNIPLFSNEQRAEIGWTYKHKGQDVAILLGESFAEPKIPTYLEQVKILARHKKILLLCARGGLRSQRFASLLDNDGYTVYRLDQGYKGYRRGAQFLFGQTLPLLILGGMTGSGKTEILKCLSEMGEQVLDLEGLAHHKGSAFGSLGMGRQPSTEQFENDLSEKIRKFSHSRRIWVEDESLSIGKIFLPLPFFEQMKRAPLVRVEMDRQNRIDRLSRDYGHESKSLLEESIRKISKRLGSESAFKSIEALQSGDLSGAVSLILDYYDKSYEYDRKLKNRSVLCRYFSPDGSPQRAAEAILELLEKSQDS